MALVLLCKKILLTSDLKCQQRGVICLLLFPHFRICGGKSLFSGLKCGLSIPLCLPAGRGVLFCGFKLCLCLLKSSKSLLIFLPGILQFCASDTAFFACSLTAFVRLYASRLAASLF